MRRVVEFLFRTVIWYCVYGSVTLARAVFFIPSGVCRHRPTCMEYARSTIMSGHLLVGPWAILFRFLKCNPLFTPERHPKNKLPSAGLER